MTDGFDFKMNTVPVGITQRADNLKEIKAALRTLGVYDRSFNHYTGMVDEMTDEYNGLYFFSCKPPQSFDASYHETAFSGKILALFITQQKHNPSVTLYEKTPNKRLGGWEIWASIQGSECYVAFRRILLGSSAKPN